MKVKIGDTIYDSNIIPILLILDDEDKNNITHMRDRDYLYCSFPKNVDKKEIVKLMRGVKNVSSKINQESK